MIAVRWTQYVCAWLCHKQWHQPNSEFRFIYCRFGLYIAQKRHPFTSNRWCDQSNSTDWYGVHALKYILALVVKNFQTDQKGQNVKKKETNHQQNKTDMHWRERKKERRETKSKHKRQQIANRLNESHLASDTFQLYRVYFIYAPFSVYRFPFERSSLDAPSFKIEMANRSNVGQICRRNREDGFAKIKKKHPQIKQMYSLWYFPFTFFSLRPFELLPFIWIVLLLCWHFQIYDNLYSIRVKDVTIKMYKCQQQQKNHVHTTFKRVSGSFEVENLALVKCRCQPKLCEVQWMTQDEEKKKPPTKQNEMKWNE